MYVLDAAAYYFHFMDPNICNLNICACIRKQILGMTLQLLTKVYLI